jgi:hypothetical protein
MRIGSILFLLFASLLSTEAAAMDAGDVVRMTRAAVGDEVITAQMKAVRARFALTADDIVRLKNEGVSDTVLKAMIDTAADATVQPAGPPAASAPAAPVPLASSVPPATGEGTLVIENLDSRDYSLQVNVPNGNIFLWNASAAEWREPLPARGSTVFRLPPGRHLFRWVGEAEGHLITVRPGGESRVVLTRTNADGGEAVYVSLFEEGQRTGGGRLVNLKNALVFPPAPVAFVQHPEPVPAVVERHYYHPAPERHVVYRPAPTRYEPRCEYRYRTASWLIPGFAYSWNRGKSRYTMGWDSHGDLGFTYGRRLGRSGYSFSWGW